MTLAESIDGKRFRVSDNPSGLSTAATVFEYRVSGAVVTGTYAGGEIIAGQLLGRIVTDDRVELRFQCVTTGLSLLSGRSIGTMSMVAGRLEMRFDWCWLPTAEPIEKSVHVEV